MLDLDAINTNLRNLIRSLLGMPNGSVRPANKNAPTGLMDKPFATVLLTLVDKRGWDDTRLSDDAAPANTSTERVTGQRRIVASVQFFRVGASNQAVRLTTLLQSSAAIAKMQAIGLGLIRCSQVNDLSSVVDTYWEERSQLDLELYLTTEEQATVETFGEFPVSVETETSTSSEVISR